MLANSDHLPLRGSGESFLLAAHHTLYLGFWRCNILILLTIKLKEGLASSVRYTLLVTGFGLIYICLADLFSSLLLSLFTLLYNSHLQPHSKHKYIHIPDPLSIIY